MLRVFLDMATPKQYAISPKDTLLAMLMHKKFEIPVLTTKEAVGKATPSKHKGSYGVQYSNLCIVGHDTKYNREHTFAHEVDERLHGHYKFLKCVLSTHPHPIIGDLKWTQCDERSWFKDAKVKKRSNKSINRNVQSPPPLLYTHPFRHFKGPHK